MILSNDQKHTFTTFGARALFERKICAGKRKRYLLPRESCFSSFFVYSCCNELLLELLFGDFSSVVLSFCDGLWSLQLVCFFKCFCSVCSVQFSHFIRTTTKNAYIIVLLYHREGRERERKRKVRNSSPLFRRIVAKPVQQNKKEIERLRELHKTQKKRIVFCTQFGANF